MDARNRKIYSLTELAASLKSVIEKNYQALYWVKAEIAKLNHYPRSGHAYPELVEKAGNRLIAQFRGTIWAADFNSINNNFIKITGEPLKDGMLILGRVSVSFHPVYGLSLAIIDIEPSFTLGEMAIEKAKTIERLKSENIFNKNKALSFPLLPRKVAVISVETSKGYSDYNQILNNYSGKYKLYNRLFPAILQGDQAVKTIIKQLRIIRKKHYMFDTIAIIRGGGGDIGLNCYNDYELAKEIATSPLPVITGIGHSTNETVSEMISWANKITPTDVAYFFLGHFEEYYQRIKDSKTKIVSLSNNMLSSEHKNINQLAKLLISNTVNTTERNKSTVTGLQKAIELYTPSYLRNLNNKLNSFSQDLSQVHKRNSIIQNNRLDNIKIRIERNSIDLLRINSDKLTTIKKHIQLVDPENVLKRGYSITLFEGKALKSTKNVKSGQIIETKLLDGTIESKIIKNKK